MLWLARPDCMPGQPRQQRSIQLMLSEYSPCEWTNEGQTPLSRSGKSILERKNTHFFLSLIQGHLSSKRVCPEDLSTLTVNSQLLTYGRFSMGYAGHRFKPRLEPLALQESRQNPETKLSYFQVPFIQKGFVALLQTELCPPKIHMMELQPLLWLYVDLGPLRI